VKERETCP